MNTIDRDKLIEDLQKIEDEFPTTREHILTTVKKTKDLILSLPSNTESREVGEINRDSFKAIFEQIHADNWKKVAIDKAYELAQQMASEKDKEIEELRKEVAYTEKMRSLCAQNCDNYRKLVLKVCDERDALKSQLSHTPPVGLFTIDDINVVMVRMAEYFSNRIDMPIVEYRAQILNSIARTTTPVSEGKIEAGVDFGNYGGSNLNIEKDEAGG